MHSRRVLVLFGAALGGRSPVSPAARVTRAPAGSVARAATLHSTARKLRCEIQFLMVPFKSVCGCDLFNKL